MRQILEAERRASIERTSLTSSVLSLAFSTTAHLAEEENFVGLARIDRELIGKVEALNSAQRVVLDMDSTEIPVYGDQENNAYNGHFEST